MENNEPTQCTQGVTDPRRFGRNNSGLTEADVSDVMCILHPCSPAAFQIVANTAERSPQNVLQDFRLESYDDQVSQTVLEEQETFILVDEGKKRGLDLALRFSTQTRRPDLGFLFGRNPQTCDVTLLTDTGRRISNLHFRIFVNESGVLMLGDMSTNGTMVDDVMLRGRAQDRQQTRMLDFGSVIQILTPNPDEFIKFIVRIPNRDGHEDEYAAKFEAYVQKQAAAEAYVQTQKAQERVHPQRPLPQTRKTQAGNSRVPLLSHQWGMQWSGGDKYNVVGQIGKGAFATVYQLATKADGQLFAAKELEKRRFMKNGVLDRKLDNEMQIMKAVSHPNIVQYVEYVDVGNHLYIIMEFVPNGDLQQFLNLRGALPESMGKLMASQVFDALDYLHKKKITHRDIKPDNILLADLEPNTFEIKLSDFGLSKVVKDNETFLKTFCGTLLYCAPEVFPHYDAHVAGKKRPRRESARQATKFHSYSQSVDIWSFGAVLWFSLCLKPPFEGVADNTGRGMFEKIMGTPLEHGDLAKLGVSDDAVALLAAMLNTDPALRPLPAACLQHKWLTGSEQALEGAIEDGLKVIAEEDEEHPDMSSLSLDGQGSSHESLDSLESEVSLHSDDIAFFDPRQSKRVKSNAYAYRDQDWLVDSSPDGLFRSIPVGPDADLPQTAQQTQRKQRLFGEISHSALESAEELKVRTSEANQVLTTEDDDRARHEEAVDDVEKGRGNSSRALPPPSGAFSSPSLLGAESMVRDMNMDSPHSSGRATNDRAALVTPEHTQHPPSNEHGQSSQSQETPRAPAQPVFSRQISLPMPASFYYDPDDPSTHTLEYASKKSGVDFSKSEPNATSESGSGSVLSSTERLSHRDRSFDPHSLPTTPPEFMKPPPRLGRLVSTPDSFEPITINLNSRDTTWGRAPSETIVYSNSLETRIAKRAIMICFCSRGFDQLPESSDWTKLPDLYSTVATGSRLGIWVNGVHLTKSEPGKDIFGRVYHGDEIVVWRGSQKQAGLKFKCEFFHGAGKVPRPPTEPRFVIEFKPTSDKGKTKGKEKSGGDGGGSLEASVAAGVTAV